MKVDKIGKLCRQAGYCQLISIGHSDDKEAQFVSTGHSVYPLPPDFPRITSEAELAAVFGWDSKKQKEVYLSTDYYCAKDDLAKINLYDSEEGELECTELPMGVIYGRAGTDHYYYVMKDGMDLRAIILPTVFKDRFFQDLDEFYAAVSDMREKK